MDMAAACPPLPRRTGGRMRPKALIVEDDRAIAELIALYLEKEGIDAEARDSAESALAAARASSFDLVVLDINLPEKDGFDFLRDFRSASPAPVIIVSARESDEDKVLGLGLGADDFVTKPFSPRVLAARARAQLRRVGLSSRQGSRAAFGPFTLDAEARTLEKDGTRVALSRKEFEVLAFLASRPGAAFRPEEIYKAVWGNEYGDLSTVAVHVQRVRRKIEDDPSSPRYLTTDPGLGYRLIGGGA